MNYYPITEKSAWTYRMKDGSTYTNSVKSVSNGIAILNNSQTNLDTEVMTDGTKFKTKYDGEGLWQVFLDNQFCGGETWEIRFKANGLNSILVMKVKQVGIIVNCAGMNYPNTIEIEAESKLEMNGTIMSLNFTTNYFYADGVGLVLTTSSLGDRHELIAYSQG